MSEREPWVQRLGAELLCYGIHIDWDRTDTCGDGAVFYAGPEMKDWCGFIYRTSEGYRVTIEVSLAHSHLDDEGARLLLDRRLEFLADAGATIREIARSPFRRNVWCADLFAHADDEKKAAEWAHQFKQHALDIAGCGADGQAVDALAVAFFRDNIRIAQVFDDLRLGLYRCDWVGLDALPVYRHHEGTGLAIFFDRRGRILKQVFARDGSIHDRIRAQFSPEAKDFVISRGIVESFWVLPLSMETSFLWGDYLENWLCSWRQGQALDRFALDSDECCD
ncbi:MAG: hypothetical protein ABIK09_06880 [Pseudomonadota bacterium]